MGQAITPFSINTPGFFGLNLQDSSVDLAPSFALTANNCVIDKSGRIAARKGWVKSHTANTEIGTNNITCIGELIQNDGTTTILAAGGGFLFKYAGTTLTTLTYGGGGSAPTISANNWQFVSLNGIGIFFQRGYDPLIYDPATSTTTFRRLSEHATYLGTVLQANCAVSAYGRIWCADTSTDKNTIKFSDVITPQIWTGGSSGSLNLLGVWPKGGDEIVALAANNNFLVIFGKKQVLIYSGATTPSTMTLADSITGIGCIARDSVQNIGDDIIFLSDSGLRSLQRTIQEKSAPLRALSKNIRDEIILHISTENVDNIKSVYSPEEAFYLIIFPAVSETYCFDCKVKLEDGSYRVTTWTLINPKCFLASKSKKLYIGEAGYIGQYSGYLDNLVSYRMLYYTPWIDFGNPVQTSILKKIMAIIIGSPSQSTIFKWAFDFIQTYRSETVTISGNQGSEWGIFEWGIGEFGGVTSVNTIATNPGGSGRVIQFGFETEIYNFPVSIQKIDIFTKNGRL